MNILLLFEWRFDRSVRWFQFMDGGNIVYAGVMVVVGEIKY